MDIPSEFGKNLEKFLYSEIKINFNIYSNKKRVGGLKFRRLIKFNKWDNEYIILEPDKNFIKKYKSFEDFIKDINKFEEISIEFIDNFNDSNGLILECDYFLKSTNFIPPFKFLEFNKKFGNMRKKIKLKINYNV